MHDAPFVDFTSPLLHWSVDAQQLTAAWSPGDLPPPIPHRILHCSWII
jgi:hypothetical protein